MGIGRAAGGGAMVAGAGMVCAGMAGACAGEDCIGIGIG
jgi:hypothetical protein